ncbi:uncharacterized protein DUF4148 [Paraburkholderia caballeronis]|uniref:DUF4148 domain-containing protein n=1 Tax=Paraburkholderia caballeronis TaxID=416943 RepID=UPI0010651822|nr:DUF4148 domain-containing protein [Paraburkholderia caballeronis]TDV25604.1 uncharacterized protein DUF4148 [Paraburkholderia caballeronis]
MNIRHLIASAAVALTAAVAAALPAAGHAGESASPLTRAQVRAELVQIEQAGYRPNRANDPHYPADIQAAEAKIHARSNDAALTRDALGGARDGSGASGERIAAHDVSGSLYAHH